MQGKVLMIQGTMSSVGKSLLVAALCRIFHQDGWRVAPFKSQNMALNSFATRDGREVGRAQAMQADAAGVDVTVEMNPVLIKPEADSFSQIVVLGRPWARLSACEYFHRRSELWSIVTNALDNLREQYDLVVIEGAGSPTELNLKRGDIVNMAIASYANAPVLLVGDIDRGGIFAQLLGTLMLLDEQERAQVRGLVVNKFRGDSRLFIDGVRILEKRGRVPVLGVVPFIRDLGIADEDSVALDTRVYAAHTPDTIDIAIIRLPRISNFDDFDPLAAEPDVVVRFVDHQDDLGTPDLLILPGTKTTINDLLWLRAHGLDRRILVLAHTGVAVLGICGGYQMLGTHIFDPYGFESKTPIVSGLGLLPLATTFTSAKQTVRAQGYILPSHGLFAGARNLVCLGYEIHMGQTTLAESAEPLFAEPLLHLTQRGDFATDITDGAVDASGWIAGTYLHGLFDNDALRQALLHSLAARRSIFRTTESTCFDRLTAYDRLAQVVREHLDMKQIYQIVQGNNRVGI